jgi:hypothetical protein
MFTILVKGKYLIDIRQSSHSKQIKFDSFGPTVFLSLFHRRDNERLEEVSE